MYCSNCGYKLTQRKIEKILKKTEGRTIDSNVVYVCPRCGKIIKNSLSNDDVKALARASHSEIHKSRNIINSGMCFLVIATILVVIGYIFYLMSYKANAGGMLVTNCTEYYVFIVLLVLGCIAYLYSFISLFFGIKKNREYNLLLKDIQNNIFIQ